MNANNDATNECRSSTFETTVSVPFEQALRSVEALHNALKVSFPSGILVSKLLRRIARDAPQHENIIVIDNVAFAKPDKTIRCTQNVCSLWNEAQLAPRALPTVRVRGALSQPSKGESKRRRTNTHLPLD